MLKLRQVLNNRYQIHAVLGEGGFGAVYKVWDDTLQRPCAIKENLQVTPESQKQFKREAIMLANLNHPHLVRVTDYFSISNQGQYLVMDFVEGDDLQTILTNNGGPLPGEQALAWIRQVCDALIYIHNQNPPIIHRDIKPANIRITPQGNAILVDFGLAKILDEGMKTSMGARGLTPYFAAPEQYGMGGTDAQSDIYSLGVTLYCLLTYSVPPDSVAIMLGDANPPPPAKAINRNIPDAISDALQRAMQIRRTDRYKSASDFKIALLTEQKSFAQVKEDVHDNITVEQHDRARYQNAYPDKIEKINAKRSEAGITLVDESVIQPEDLVGKTICFWYGKFRILGKRDITAENLNVYIALIAREGYRVEILEEKKPVVETPKPVQIVVPRIVTPPSNKLTLSNGMEFMRVPAGKFLMESDKSNSDEKPLHTVDIPYDYWMARFPVTNEQYNAYAKAKGIHHPVDGWEKKKDHPVVNVNWNTVMEYCQWLNNLLKAELPLRMVLRLPSEAEWEKAARGTDGREYPWGNEFDKNKCNSKEGGKGSTTSVGLYSPRGDSPYGCADMSGNVWEWTRSLKKEYYPYKASDGGYDDNPYKATVGSDGNLYKVIFDGYDETFPRRVIAGHNDEKIFGPVLRGGTFFNDNMNVRCACRDNGIPFSYPYGIRVVVSPIIEEKKPVIEIPKPIQVVTPKTVTPPSNNLILSNGMEFMRVPAGKFIMGSDNGGDNQKPQHAVDIPYDYWMARFPVTNEQYNVYVKAKGIDHPVTRWEKKKDHPVTEVSWDDARAYCKWLNDLLKNELPSSLVLRLPIEVEWEKAARGTDGREYPWGNMFDKNKCNSKEGGKGDTTPIGLYSPQGDSTYGCADMAGNVFEWCNDWYSYDQNSPSLNPLGPNSGIHRPLLGGSWLGDESDSRSSSRSWVTSDGTNLFIGFRCACSLP